MAICISYILNEKTNLIIVTINFSLFSILEIKLKLFSQLDWFLNASVRGLDYGLSLLVPFLHVELC